jgi:hypothetical protein
MSPCSGAFGVGRSPIVATTITTVEVERELILETATTLEFIGRHVRDFLCGAQVPLTELADHTAFHLVVTGLGRSFEELMAEADGSPLNEWAEVEARVEKRMEDWPDWSSPLEGVTVD